MKVSEIMTTNPACCIPSDAAQTAALIMRDEDTGIVPVVENKGSRKLVGVVTDRDLEEVFALMRENQVRRVVVVDQKNEIQGVVSLSDLMMRGAVPKGETHQTLKGISMPTGEASKPRAESADAASKTK